MPRQHRQTIIFLIVVITLAVVAYSRTPSTLAQTPPPTSTPLEALLTEQIAYTSLNGSGTYQIWVMNGDGSGKRQLTRSNAQNESPAWSPDGKHIAYVSTANNKTPQIYVMNANGSQQANISQNSYVDSNPAWSPDGKHIAFVTIRDRFNQIYVMNTDGSNPINLSNNTFDDFGPDWLPDGTQILYRQKDDKYHTPIYIMNADGSGQMILRDSSTKENVLSANWSPNGQRILYQSDITGGFYVIDTDGKNPTLLLATSNCTDPQWSTGGDYIACEEPTAAGTVQIYLLNLDGSQAINLTRNKALNFDPAWKPIPKLLATPAATQQP